MWPMRHRSEFERFVGYEIRQLKVNKDADLQCYAGTCYHAEQYAEKTLKARMQDFGIGFKYIHDPGKLVQALAVGTCQRLDDKWYIEAYDAAKALDLIYRVVRYPNHSEGVPTKVTRRMAEKALKDADTVVTWANSIRPSEPVVSCSVKNAPSVRTRRRE